VTSPALSGSPLGYIADPKVSRVVHLGDIKNGSSRCDTTYFQARLADFNRFADPLVYTPGDNEWTDCHRANNGAYLPIERLDTLRRLFFAKLGQTLGKRRAAVIRLERTQADVAALALDLGVSERQLRRRFECAVGYGPKRLGRVLRLTRALDGARAGTPLGRAAVEAGYADHAHFANDCRDLAGVAPSVLLAC